MIQDCATSCMQEGPATFRVHSRAPSSTSEFYNRFREAILFLFTAFGIFLLFASQAHAIEPVSGQYRSTFGTIVQLDLRVSYPPPASIIIEQYFPVGLQVISSEPALRKINDTRGVAKWLLKGVEPGFYSFSLRFDRPVQSSIFHAIIRYRNPQRGSFVEYRITP